MEDPHRPHGASVTPNQSKQERGSAYHHYYSGPVDHLGGSDHVDVDPDRILDRVGSVAGKGPASRIRLLVYDDYLKSPTSKDLVSYSYTELDNILGLFDQLAFHVVAGDAIVGGTAPLMLALQMQHSADGINWINKNTVPEISLTQVLSGTGATPTTTVLPPGYDNGTSPSLAFVRVRMNLKTSGTGSAAPMSAKIKVWVTCNDRHEARFSEEQRHKWVKRIKDAVKAVEKRRSAEEEALKEQRIADAHKARVKICSAQYAALKMPADSTKLRSWELLRANVERMCAAQGVSALEVTTGVTDAHRAGEAKAEEEAKAKARAKAKAKAKAKADQ